MGLVVRNLPFVDRNKRTAITAAGLCWEVNGCPAQTRTWYLSRGDQVFTSGFQGLGSEVAMKGLWLDQLAISAYRSSLSKALADWRYATALSKAKISIPTISTISWMGV